MKILAIETSCDETAIAILETTGSRQKPVFKLLSNIVLSQIKIHKPFGGVVPNLAQREHQKNLPFILKTALQEAGLSINLGVRLPSGSRTPNSKSKFLISKQIPKNKNQQQKLKTTNEKLSTILNREPELWKLFQKHILPLQSPLIDAIAVTSGPGLEPALWVGINFAKALAVLWNKPLIPVNHLEGHVYASWLPPKPEYTSTPHPPSLRRRGARGEVMLTSYTSENSSLITHHYPRFPILALIVSGGHTELVLMKKHLNYKILGETRDDAAGEAFDKVAKMLGLGYPGGPEIAKMAEKGNPSAISFPRPMINSNNYDFSFSGLKTSVLYLLRDQKLLDENSRRGRANHVCGIGVKEFSDKSFWSKNNIAASFEQAVVDVLVAKTAKALEHYNVRTLVVGGGVAANTKLRSSLESLITHRYPLTALYLSPLWLCGDNAAMIAAAAYFRSFQKKKFDIAKLRANGNLRLHK